MLAGDLAGRGFRGYDDGVVGDLLDSFAGFSCPARAGGSHSGDETVDVDAWWVVSAKF